MTEAQTILTPVGRIVQGDCFKPQTTDMSGNPLTIKTGPNAGQPRVNYFIGVAVRKDNPEVNQLLQLIHGTAQASFPQMFDASGNCINPKFSFKYVDGDSPALNEAGRAWNSIEGFPGHWVFRFSSGYEPQCVTQGGDAAIVDPSQIKRGYFVRIYTSLAGNGNATRPGIYLNLHMVELIAYGEEIKSGPDAKQIFGSAPAAQLPPGASATPVAPATQVAPPTAAGVQPAQDFLKPQGQAAAAPPPAAAPVTERFVHPNGQIFNREQLTASGWTDAQIAQLPRG